MEKKERSPEQQVWERVFAQKEEPARQELRQLRMAAAELASAYRYLTGIMTGKERTRAAALYQEQLETAACLKGIGILSGQGEEVLKLWKPSKEPARKMLEKCYHRSRRCMVEYMARSAEGEFGTVFRHLADREGAHCTILAGMLGRTEQEGRKLQGK